MSLNSMPPEIMQMILHPSNHIKRSGFVIAKRESTKGYSALRLVSKEFCAHVTPHIFKNLTIGNGEYSLKRLEGVTESEEIRGLVRQYTYALTPNSPVRKANPRNIHHEYLRLLADPECAEKLAAIDSSIDPQMMKIARWLEQREFDLSNDIHDIHVKCLSSLPVLRSIHLTSPTWCGLSEKSPALCYSGAINTKSSGPAVFRAILLAMHNRIEANLIPVEEFVLKGVTEECMILPPKIFQKAILGFRGVKSLVISIQTCHNLGEFCPGWITLLGRLLQSATSLESLEIETPPESSVKLNNIASPFRHRSSNKLESPLTEICWPKLKSLTLREMVFSESQILQFLASHQKSLRAIHFENCELSKPCLPDGDQSESESKSEHGSDDEDIVVRKPWEVVLSQIAKQFPPKTPSALDSFTISSLHHQDAKTLRNCSTKLWQEYISGINDHEPSDRGEKCTCDLLDNSGEGSSITDESEFGFWSLSHHHGMHPFGFEDSDLDDDFDDMDEEEEFYQEEDDIGIDGGFIIPHPPGLHPYPWGWPHTGDQEY